jgi:nucleoid DNA-binding protein
MAAKKAKKAPKKAAPKAKAKAKAKGGKAKATAKKATSKAAKKTTAKAATKKAARTTTMTKAAPKAEKHVIGPAKTNFESVNRVRSKGQILNAIAGSTGLSKREVGDVMNTLTDLVGHDLAAAGIFTLPGVVKMQVRKKPATKARKGINPFTGQEIMIKAKPATNVVRARPLKALKDQL